MIQDNYVPASVEKKTKRIEEEKKQLEKDIIEYFEFKKDKIWGKGIYKWEKFK